MAKSLPTINPIRKSIAIVLSTGFFVLAGCTDAEPGSAEEAFYNFEYELLCSARKAADVANKKYLLDDTTTYDTVRADLKERIANNEDYVAGCLFLTFSNRGIRAREVSLGKYYIEEEIGGQYSRVPRYHVVQRHGKFKIAAGD